MIALSHVILVLPVALLLKLWESALPLNVPGEHAPDTVTEQLSPVARPDRLKLTHPPLFIRPPRLPLSVIFGPELFVEATSAGSARSLHPPLQPELLQPKAPEFNDALMDRKGFRASQTNVGVIPKQPGNFLSFRKTFEKLHGIAFSKERLRPDSNWTTCQRYCVQRTC